MKVLGNLPLVKDTNTKYPFGANIQDETSTIDGTPIVRDLYGDIVMNLYRILELTNENPNNSEDNKDTQFQLVNAFKKLANDINDVQHVLTYDVGGWSLDLDFTILPNNFICIVTPSDDYNTNLTNNIIDINNVSKPIITDGFKASSIVMLIVGNTDVKAVQLSKNTQIEKVFPTFGGLLNYNSDTVLGYSNNGVLLFDDLSNRNIESEIRVELSDGTLIVDDIFVGITNNSNRITLFTVKKPSDTSYFKVFYYINNGVFIDLLFTGYIDSPTNVNNPLILFDGTNLYMTNGSGSLSNNLILDSYVINDVGNQLLFSTRITLDSNFEKTLNSVVKSGFIYTYNSSFLKKFSLASGIKTDIVELPGINGQLFNFNNNLYLSTGEVATKLTV